MAVASIFTPLYSAHNQYVSEAYQSLVSQTSQDWEWVVYLNNGGQLPEGIAADRRVRVIDGTSDCTDLENTPQIVGFAKHQAASACETDVLIEMDSDDILLPDAVAEVVQACREGAGFVYSDWAEFNAEWESRKYTHWQPYLFEHRGHTLHALRPWGPDNAQAFGRLATCPNHVRAWSRAAYWRVGGHAKDIALAEDYDLIVRTYVGLGSAAIRHIPKCLYLYRRHEGGGTFNQWGATIKETQGEVYKEYRHKIAQRWCWDKGLRAIEIAGPCNTIDGYETVSYHDCAGFMIGRWPFKAGSIGAIRAAYVFDHLPAVETMNEVWRVLAPGGFLFATVPSANTSLGLRDPTARSWWTMDTPRYFADHEFRQHVSHAFAGAFQLRWRSQYHVDGGMAIDFDLLKPGERPINLG